MVRFLYQSKFFGPVFLLEKNFNVKILKSGTERKFGSFLTEHMIVEIVVWMTLQSFKPKLLISEGYPDEI